MAIRIILPSITKLSLMMLYIIMLSVMTHRRVIL
jgi:hypothetical protein